MRPVLVTGGAGFVGTNLADRLLRDGRVVRILDNLSRPGVEANLEWLRQRHGDALEVELSDICDASAVARAMHGVDAVFHFAAQVAVTTSLADPLHDAAVNLHGSLNVLEAARARPRPPAIIFTSTNKVYGSLSDVDLREEERGYLPVDPGIRARGVSEARPLSFCTPYGCSKGAADQYVLDYAASYSVPTVAFRMSCIYGPHQFGTEDQGWVAHFLICALEGRDITIYGDGKQVRDILFVDDLVEALMRAERNAVTLAGHPFNMGGGPERAISLLDLLSMVQTLQGSPAGVQFSAWRPGDQLYYVSDARRFRAATGWEPSVAAADGVERLYRWLATRRSRMPLSAAAEAVA